MHTNRNLNIRKFNINIERLSVFLGCNAMSCGVARKSNTMCAVLMPIEVCLEWVI